MWLEEGPSLCLLMRHSGQRRCEQQYSVRFLHFLKPPAPGVPCRGLEKGPQFLTLDRWST